MFGRLEAGLNNAPGGRQGMNYAIVKRSVTAVLISIVSIVVFPPSNGCTQSSTIKVDGEKFDEEHFCRGNEYFDKGDYDRAIADYTKAIEINPNYAKAYNDRGMAYMELGDMENGCRDFAGACKAGSCYVYDGVKSKGYCK
jgi:tetratricopeptide (TPR) repeat protein